GGKVADRQVTRHILAPGTDQKLDVLLPIPLTSQARTPGTWTLTLAQNGKEVFRDTKPLTVLRVAVFSPPAPFGGALPVGANLPLDRISSAGRFARGEPASGATKSSEALALAGKAAPPKGAGGEKKAKQLCVFDPRGTVRVFLRAHGTPFTSLASLAALPASGRVLIVGKDALSAADATSPRLAAWATGGRGVIVLEQRNPLKYQGMPAAMEPAENEGRVGFREDDSHPAFQNLTDADFFTWGGEREILYRNAYEKPTRGGKSLLQVDKRLGSSALAEIPAGEGILLVTQLLVGETLNQNPVAQQLLVNLVRYAAAYRPVVRPVTVAASAESKLSGVLSAVGVAHQAAGGPLKALARTGGIAVIEATPANLKLLAANLPKVKAFHASGGWIVFNGLTPDGLADYNRIVGVDHMIRPFRRERVTFPEKKNPLTAGLSTGDVVLSSGERINGFNQDEYTADDEFSYVVDFDEVGSFLAPPDPKQWGLSDTSNDHNPLNAVNGYTSADSWKLAFMMWAADPKNPPSYPIRLPRAQEFTRLEWVGNATYQRTEQIQLVFDNGKTVTLETAPNNESQSFTLPPGCSGKNVTLKVTRWTPSPNPEVKLVGIDYFRLYAKRSPEFRKTVRPILTVGGLMEYVKGQGGIVLCNVKFQDTESVPVNAVKKRNVLATLLRNLDASVGGAAGVIIGSANLVYSPVDLSKAANQYRTDRGWFGDKRFTFADLPPGKQSFGGVPFSVYDFATSPVPNAVMLGGNGVPGGLPEAVRGIPVNRKADALFFLHTARLDSQRNEREVREKKQYEMARYVVTYSDGKTVTVPVYAEISIGDYRPKSPASGLSGASLAWTKPYAGTDRAAAAYQMQWNNPRPDTAIASLDLEYGPDRRGVPALLAVTAVTSRNPQQAKQ
ncbi:MAG: hypothetical protein H7Z41_00120, partial [Cytophagales bacterium]|nr:hypothetical protein [Armatimonadota bacterium]